MPSSPLPSPPDPSDSSDAPDSLHRYSMQEGLSVAQLATQDIEEWLRSLPQTRSVENVEGDPRYQAQDVDLIWTTSRGRYRVEIKGDRWHGTGNFFFETMSNQERGTLGCFLYTEADLLFYYFVEPRELYILPMPATREWFLANRVRFRQSSTTTDLGRGRTYTTVGHLVPIQAVLAEVEGVYVYTI